MQNPVSVYKRESLLKHTIRVSAYCPRRRGLPGLREVVGSSAGTLSSKIRITMATLFLIKLGAILCTLGSIFASQTVQCSALGFTEALECSTCEALGTVGLTSECLACCTESSEDAKYSTIVLEMDKRSLDFYPQISKVVSMSKKGEEPFNELVVRYKFNARPQLHLFLEENDDFPADSVSVYSWDFEVIKDFVKSNMKESRTVEASEL